jgi:tRNA pseudouridine65 synthase
MNKAELEKLILHEDEHLLVVNKPAALLVHRSVMTSLAEPSLCMLLAALRNENLMAVHRIDRATSGIVVLARTKTAARHLGLQFQGREVVKNYVAVVRGYTRPELIIDYPLSRLEEENDKESLQQQAVTVVRTLATLELPYAVEGYPAARYSLVQLMPQTGRRHQLRRHMKHISHPIIGDTAYGRGAHNRFFRDHFGVSRMLLHACRLEILHPVSQAKLVFTAALDEPFQKIAGLFGVPSAF